jgi:hypothetical protein
MEHVYVLDPGLNPDLFGGSVALPSGELFDVAQALRDGNGEIRTRDDKLAAILDVYHGVELKERNEDPEPLPETGPPEGGYGKLLKTDLEHLVATRGVTPEGDKKDDLIAALEAHDQAAGIDNSGDGDGQPDDSAGDGGTEG